MNVPPENIIYIADECYAERSYNKEFLSQFNKIASVGSNIGIDNKINIHELTIWYFKNNINILNLEPIKKTNKLYNAKLLCRFRRKKMPSNHLFLN